MAEKRKIPDVIVQKKYLKWVNDSLDLNCKDFKDFSNCAIYCEIMFILNNNSFPIHKINYTTVPFSSKEAYKNVQLIEKPLKDNGIKVNIKKLSDGNTSEHLDLIRKLKNQWDRTNPQITESLQKIKIERLWAEKIAKRRASITKPESYAYRELKQIQLRAEEQSKSRFETFKKSLLNVEETRRNKDLEAMKERLVSNLPLLEGILNQVKRVQYVNTEVAFFALTESMQADLNKIKITTSGILARKQRCDEVKVEIKQAEDDSEKLKVKKAQKFCVIF